MSSSPRMWTDVGPDAAATIRQHLLEQGGQEAQSVGPHESWRIRLQGATVTMFLSGKMYFTASAAAGPLEAAASEFIDGVAPPRFDPSDRTFLIGLDESGKSEPIGDAVLVGVSVPGAIVPHVESIVALAKTKSKHPARYWETLFMKLEGLKDDGLNFVVDRLESEQIVRYNMNGLFDVVYARILRAQLRVARPESTRVVVDDYGIAGILRLCLEEVKARGVEVVTQDGADDRFIEARVASVIARHERERIVEAINRDPQWEVRGLRVGSGHARNAKTLDWLRAWKGTGQEWPSFVRWSSKTVCKIDGRPVPKKPYPPKHGGPCRDLEFAPVGDR